MVAFRVSDTLINNLFSSNIHAWFILDGWCFRLIFIFSLLCSFINTRWSLELSLHPVMSILKSTGWSCGKPMKFAPNRGRGKNILDPEIRHCLICFEVCFEFWIVTMWCWICWIGTSWGSWRRLRRVTAKFWPLTRLVYYFIIMLIFLRFYFLDEFIELFDYWDINIK